MRCPPRQRKTALHGDITQTSFSHTVCHRLETTMQQQALSDMDLLVKTNNQNQAPRKSRLLLSPDSVTYWGSCFKYRKSCMRARARACEPGCWPGLSHRSSHPHYHLYIQPSQPWKIHDATSAGSQRLCLSGLASRIHTINKYTFPPTAETALRQLIELFTKGHPDTACWRFLKKFGARARPAGVRTS